MDIYYKPQFRKFVKKQTKAFQLAIEDEADRIRVEPSIGEAKKGDLAGFRVHKFIFHKQEYLVAYKVSDQVVIYLIGTHENFYRDLKHYIREAD